MLMQVFYFVDLLCMIASAFQCFVVIGALKVGWLCF